MPEIASSAGEPGARRRRADAAERRAAAGRDPLALDLDLQEVALQAQYEAGESLVGDEDVRAHPEQRERLAARRRRRRERRASPASVSHAAEEPRRARRSARSCGARAARSRATEPSSGARSRSISAQRDATASDRGPGAAGRRGTSSTTTPQPPGRSWRRRIRAGFTMSKRRKSEKGRGPGPAGGARGVEEERHRRAGEQLPGDLVDDDAARVLRPERAADRPGNARRRSSRRRARTSRVRPPSRRLDAVRRREKPGPAGAGRGPSRRCRARPARAPRRSRWREASPAGLAGTRGGRPTLTPDRAGEKIRRPHRVLRRHSRSL